MDSTKKELMAELQAILQIGDRNNNELKQLAAKVGTYPMFLQGMGKNGLPEMTTRIINAIQAVHTERQTNALLEQIKSSNDQITWIRNQAKSSNRVTWIAVLISFVACVVTIITLFKGS